MIKTFNFFWSGGADNTTGKKSSLIRCLFSKLSGNRTSVINLDRERKVSLFRLVYMSILLYDNT